MKNVARTIPFDSEFPTNSVSSWQLFVINREIHHSSDKKWRRFFTAIADGRSLKFLEPATRSFTTSDELSNYLIGGRTESCAVENRAATISLFRNRGWQPRFVNVDHDEAEFSVNIETFHVEWFLS